MRKLIKSLALQVLVSARAYSHHGDGAATELLELCNIVFAGLGQFVKRADALISSEIRNFLIHRRTAPALERGGEIPADVRVFL
jgi:hypothetical protein